MDEHKWSHVLGRDGDGFVTVITDLTTVVAGDGPARLLDMVAGRSTAAFSSWLAARTPEFRERVEIVAMDGFGSYERAAVEALPDAVTVTDPFHVVAHAGHKLDLCRQRVWQDTQLRRRPTPLVGRQREADLVRRRTGGRCRARPIPR